VAWPSSNSSIGGRPTIVAGKIGFSRIVIDRDVHLRIEIGEGVEPGVISEGPR